MTVLSGYLGAGKTTLLNRLLREAHDIRIGVIVNDFGTIDIDGDLIASHDGTTISLANGCVCCSLSDGFFTAMTSMRGLDPAIDHLVVEASGVADPLKIAQWAKTPGFALDGVVVAADAMHVRTHASDRYIGGVVVQQLRGADVIVLTKTDVRAASSASASQWLSQYLPTPLVVAADVQSMRALLCGVQQRRRVRGDSAERMDLGADHVPHVTVSFSTDALIDRTRFESTIFALPDGVLRAKGILRFDDDPGVAMVFHLVGDRVELTVRGAWTEGDESRAVAIASRSPCVDADTIDKWLRNLFGRDC